jgi:hypothetical protein
MHATLQMLALRIAVGVVLLLLVADVGMAHHPR